MKKLSILMAFALLTGTALYCETPSQQTIDNHLEALNSFLPNGFTFKQERVEESTSETHTEVRLVNPAIYLFGGVPIVRQEGDLIIRSQGKEYTFSTTGMTHILFGANLDITSPLSVKVLRSGEALSPSASFKDLLQTWEQFEFQIGKGELRSLDQQQKPLIAEITRLAGKLIHLESGKNKYSFESTAENLNFPGLDSQSCKEIFSLIQKFNGPEALNNAFCGSFFAPSPNDYGPINFSFNGTLNIPNVNDLAKIALTANTNPMEALKLASEKNISIDFATWEYSDRFAASKGTSSIRTSIADNLSRAVIENQSQINFSQAYTERLKTSLIQVRKVLLGNELSEKISEQEVIALIPHLHELGTIKSAIGITLDIKDPFIEKGSFHASFSLEKPNMGMAFSGFVDEVTNPAESRGKLTLKVANYEEMIGRGVPFYNQLIDLFSKIDQGGKWVRLTPEQVEMGKQALLFCCNNTTNQGKDIQIDLDYTDPAHPKIGKIPLDQYPLAYILSTFLGLSGQ